MTALKWMILTLDPKAIIGYGIADCWRDICSVQNQVDINYEL